MVTNSELQEKSLYEIDYNLWVLETVKKIENREFDSIDWENLKEEVLSLAREDKLELNNLLCRFFEYSLELNYWQSIDSKYQRHCQAEKTRCRIEIKHILRDSPSLYYYLQEILEECYQDGIDLASTRSGLPLSIFPESPICNVEQILDEDWLP
jgi:hypothetical protein